MAAAPQILKKSGAAGAAGCVEGLCPHRGNDSLHFVRRSAPSKCVRCASLSLRGRKPFPGRTRAARGGARWRPESSEPGPQSGPWRSRPLPSRCARHPPPEWGWASNREERNAFFKICGEAATTPSRRRRVKLKNLKNPFPLWYCVPPSPRRQWDNHRGTKSRQPSH